MTTRRSTKDRRQAFTLIEVLLAVAIFAVVLAAINTVFYSALRLRRTTTRLLDENIPVEQALTIMRRDLQGVVAPGGALAGSFQSLNAATTMGQGSGNGVQFYSSTGRLSDAAPWGDVQKITYQLKSPTNATDALGLDLVRTVTRNLLPVTQEDYVDQPLLSNVAQMELAYYDGSSWLDTWDSSTATTPLPKAVRVLILRATEDPQAQRNQQPLQLIVPIIAESRTNQTENSSSSQ